MSARHVMSDTPRSVTRIDPSCCPWCRCRIERDDAIERVGHEWLHRTCAADWESVQAENEAVLAFGTLYEYERRRKA